MHRYHTLISIYCIVSYAHLRNITLYFDIHQLYCVLCTLKIMLQLCAGLKNMHNLDPPYAHNDVKPGNVLLTHRKGQSPLAILMDFGSARPARKQIRSRSEALQLQVIIFYSLPFPFTFFWIIISYSFILIFHKYYFQQPS
jgi:serine/threonine protein kinase